ncbi:MAG: hypothetical protein M3N26_11815, partial [Pseudomonadota bacterium]|nr:hypothetical protein [Pseudomonadota bacterium]
MNVSSYERRNERRMRERSLGAERSCRSRSHVKFKHLLGEARVDARRNDPSRHRKASSSAMFCTIFAAPPFSCAASTC